MDRFPGDAALAEGRGRPDHARCVHRPKAWSRYLSGLIWPMHCH